MLGRIHIPMIIPSKAFLIVVLMLMFSPCALAVPPDHDWTASFAGGTYGFMGYPEGCYLFYGSGKFYLSGYSVYLVAGVVALVVLFFCGLSLYLLRGFVRLWTPRTSHDDVA
jgi:hypothetical protein